MQKNLLYIHQNINWPAKTRDVNFDLTNDPQYLTKAQL